MAADRELKVHWLFMLYLMASAVTFVAYGVDKWAAMRGGRRVRERDLHVLELLGGWPGALVGQAVFKHKRRKAEYMGVLMGIVILHLGVWVMVWHFR